MKTYIVQKRTVCFSMFDVEVEDAIWNNGEILGVFASNDDAKAFIERHRRQDMEELGVNAENEDEVEEFDDTFDYYINDCEVK